MYIFRILIPILLTSLSVLEGVYQRECCRPFGMFYQRRITFNLEARSRTPLIFDTAAFTTEKISLDISTGKIILKQTGYWLVHGSFLVFNSSDESAAPIDIGVHISEKGIIMGSGRPTIIRPEEYKRVTTSIIVKVCDDCAYLTLFLLNPENRSIRLHQTMLHETDSIPVLDVIYLGPLLCIHNE